MLNQVILPEYFRFPGYLSRAAQTLRRVSREVQFSPRTCLNHARLADRGLRRGSSSLMFQMAWQRSPRLGSWVQSSWG